jgi:hypothetical protein
MRYRVSKLGISDIYERVSPTSFSRVTMLTFTLKTGRTFKQTRLGSQRPNLEAW